MSTEPETGTVTQRILYRDLSEQNDMDFVIEMSFCKTPVVNEKRLVFRGWSHLGKSFKVAQQGYARLRSARQWPQPKVNILVLFAIFLIKATET